MTGSFSYALPVFLTCAGLFVCLAFLWAKRTSYASRMEELGYVESYLEAYYTSYNSFISDKDSPQILINFLMTIHMAMSSRTIANRFLQIKSNNTTAANKTADEEVDRLNQLVSSELQKLEVKRADLALKFYRASLSGFAVATLRWPETTDLFYKVFHTHVVNPENEFRMIIRASEGINFGGQGTPTGGGNLALA